MPRVRAIWARGVLAWSRTRTAAMVSAARPGRPGMAAGGAGCRYPGGCALGDNGSLELGDRTKYMEDQPAAGSGGVDGFDERAQLDAAALQVAGDGEQVGERTAEAVKPPHHEHATAAGVVE